MIDVVSLKNQLTRATILIARKEFAAAEELLRACGEHPAASSLGPKTAMDLPRRLHSAWLKLAKARGDNESRIALQYQLVPPQEVLSPLFPLTVEGRHAHLKAATQRVPHVLHQIWIGSPPPETTNVWRDHSERNGWTYRLWDERALSALSVEDDPVYRHMLQAKDFPGAVDVARYHVLRADAGVYLDCDWMPVRSEGLDQIIPMTGLSAMAEKTPRLTGVGSPFLNNSVIAAPPSHPVFQTLIETLPRVVDALPNGPAWWVTGPLVFTLACRAGPVTVLDAGIDAGASTGDLRDVERYIKILQKNGSTAYFCGWKPWEVTTAT